jgi:hypothetical protein
MQRRRLCQVGPEFKLVFAMRHDAQAISILDNKTGTGNKHEINHECVAYEVLLNAPSTAFLCAENVASYHWQRLILRI